MKHIFFMSITASLLALIGCKDQTGSDYYDLNKGEKVSLVKDENTGLMVDAETKKPVYIYVNKETKDTIYGATGKVINGHVIRLEDGEYKYDELKVKLDEGVDYKKKVEADGDTKIKEGDSKKKTDAETGEVKNK